MNLLLAGRFHIPETISALKMEHTTTRVVATDWRHQLVAHELFGGVENVQSRRRQECFTTNAYQIVFQTKKGVTSNTRHDELHTGLISWIFRKPPTELISLYTTHVHPEYQLPLLFQSHNRKTKPSQSPKTTKAKPTSPLHIYISTSNHT